MRKYGAHIDALAIIVLSTRAHGLKKIQLSKRVAVHPTDSRAWPLYMWDCIRIARTLKKPDLVSTQDPFEVGFVGWIISRIHHVPLYVQIHTDFSAPGYARGSIVRHGRQILSRFVFARAARVRVVLARTAESLKRRGLKVPVSILPVYVDIQRYASIVRKKHSRFKIALLVVSRLEKEKCVDCVIRALAAARAAGHEASLTIVGDGSLRTELESYARAKEVDHFVEFEGWKDDVTPYLATASLVLVPSDYEGYGMTIVEALAAGVPVLSTDVGIAREAGAIITSPQDFSHAVIRWIERGCRKAVLKGYPYKDFDEYCDKVVADMRACIDDVQKK
jgi:glycosyltransferase involved in cell wall biosynthesis